MNATLVLAALLFVADGGPQFKDGVTLLGRSVPRFGFGPLTVRSTNSSRYRESLLRKSIRRKLLLTSLCYWDLEPEEASDGEKTAQEPLRRCWQTLNWLKS